MFRKLAVPLAFMLATASLGSYASPLATKADTAETNVSYMLRNAATGRYLTVQNQKYEAGANVCEYDADGIDSGNVWRLTQKEDGQYTLQSSESSLYLTVNDSGSLTLGAEEQGSIFQRFTIEENGDTARLTAGGWAASPAASENNGADVRMDSVENAGARADWELIQVSDLVLGDLCKDGKVDVFDLVCARKLLTDSSTANPVALSVADVNASGDVEIADLVLMNRYLLGAEKFPTSTVTLRQNTIFPYVEEANPNPDPDPTPDPDPDPTPDPNPGQQITLADMPAEYKEAMEWIWQNRFVREGSTTRQNTIIDQIIAGKGTLNFVVRWQSYNTITYEQRQQFETLASNCVNAWNDYLKGYDGWQYDHIDVKIVGWAVIDKSCLLDLHDDEIVYDNLIEPYDSSYDTSNGRDVIPDKLPSAPSELSRFDHFFDKSYQYPGGLDKRFDMYLWCTQGFPDIGGAGGDWGQRLSDTAYLNMLNGFGLHVLIHEIGHGFGITDFYGANGAMDGPPPNGFPDNGTSIMMAGSSSEITEFDGWMLRYIWSNIKDEAGRF